MVTIPWIAIVLIIVLCLLIGLIAGHASLKSALFDDGYFVKRIGGTMAKEAHYVVYSIKLEEIK